MSIANDTLSSHLERWIENRVVTTFEVVLDNNEWTAPLDKFSQWISVIKITDHSGNFIKFYYDPNFSSITISYYDSLVVPKVLLYEDDNTMKKFLSVANELFTRELLLRCEDTEY